MIIHHVRGVFKLIKRGCNLDKKRMRMNETKITSREINLLEFGECKISKRDLEHLSSIESNYST